VKVNVKYKFFVLIFLFVLPAASQQLSVKTDRANAIYDINSTAIFTVSCSAGSEIEYVLSNDGRDVIKSGTIECIDGNAQIEGCLNKAGFLLCSVSCISAAGEQSTASIGAGFEPEKIKPAENHLPKDFDAFWKKHKQLLNSIPLKSELTFVSDQNGFTIYDANISCYGQPVRGYYARPNGARKHSCPAIAFFQGAGVYSANTVWIKQYCKKGFIALEVNAHGLRNGRARNFYDDIHNTTLKDYQYFGRTDREKSYFLGMFLRAVRTLQFLKAQPEWDGKILVAFGTSQGGAQAIAAGGLDTDVTFVFAGVPAMCDHGGYIAGWPRWADFKPNGCYNQTMLNTSKYFDCVNFACKTKADGFFTVGFADQICRPTSIYAMYNSYQGRKEIFSVPDMGHSIPAEHEQMAQQRILNHAFQRHQ